MDSGSDVVQPAFEDDLVQPSGGGARQRRAPREFMAILCNATFVRAIVWVFVQVVHFDDRPRFGLQHCVSRIEALEQPLEHAGALTSAAIIAGLRRVAHSRLCLRILLRPGVGAVPVLSFGASLVDRVVHDACGFLYMVRVHNFQAAGDAELLFPRPGRKAFRLAVAHSVELRGAAADERPRKQRKSDLAPSQVRERILWLRAGLFLRDQRDLRASMQAVCAAKEGQWEAQDTSADPPSRQVRQRDIIRLDAIACLIQRRQSRRPHADTTRGLRCDGSPKLNAEIVAVEVECFEAGALARRSCDMLPGGTVAHGHSGLPQKLMQFLWGLWLVFGPTRPQLQAVLDSFRWVVSDFGVEHSIADARNVLPIFFAWASGDDPSTFPPIEQGSHLLDNAIFIPGWNHLWSNMVESACSSIPSWPEKLHKMRKLTKFLRIDDYRYAWARCLRRAGLDSEATMLEQRFAGSFLHWRWETLVMVCSEISRLRHILRDYFQPHMFGELEDSSLLGDLSDILRDDGFLVWVAKLAELLGLAEAARRWGGWCSCCPAGHNEPCPARSRRLHEARNRVELFFQDLQQWRRGVTLESCAGKLAVQADMWQASGVLFAEVRLRMGWLSQLPYLVVRICEPAVAQQALDQWEAKADMLHHRVTRRLMHELGDDIRVVARGGAPSGALRREQRLARLTPLSESSIEGYHAEVQREVCRAHASRLAWVFARLRAVANIDRIAQFASGRRADEVLAYEWNRYKRVVQVSRNERAKRMGGRAFRSLFYRTRDDAVGCVNPSGDRWSSSLSAKLPPQSIMHLVRHDYLAKLLTPSCFYTLAVSGTGAGRFGIVVFQLLTWRSGREHLVDTGAKPDLRMKAVVQTLTIWRAEGGDRYPPVALTVYAAGEPNETDIWSMAAGWTSFRENLRVWSSRDSDNSGCIDLVEPSSVEDGSDVLSIACPVVLRLEALRDRGAPAMFGAGLASPSCMPPRL